MFNESSMGGIGGISEKEIHPEQKLSDEQEEKLQETKEVFDKQYRFIINGLKNNKTLPDFYKDSSDKLDEILEGVVEESNNQEIINNLVEAVNIYRKIFIDHFENRSNTDFFDAVDDAKSEKGEKLKTEKVESNNPEECINSILNEEIDYQETIEELKQVDKEITKIMKKMTINPLALQHRIARDLLKEAGEGNDSKKLVYTTIAKNALENYKVMIQSPDMRRVLNIGDSNGEPIIKSDTLEEELKELIEKEEEEKGGGNEEGIKEAREKIKEIGLDENKKREIKELEEKKTKRLEQYKELDLEYRKFETKSKIFKLTHSKEIQGVIKMRSDINKMIEKINQEIREIKNHKKL